MRNIKFRIWDNNLKKFVTAVPTGGFDLAFIRMTLCGNLFWETEYGEGDLDKERYITQQFTGLKDKNGIEIYEGDILRDKFGIYKVDWTNWVGEIIFVNDIQDAFNLSEFGVENSEIIGNIFENPELLVDKNKESL